MSGLPIAIFQNRDWKPMWTYYNPIPNSNPPAPDLTNPVNLTGYSAKMQIRTSKSQIGNTLLATLATGATPDGSPGNSGRITLGGSAGTVSPELLAAFTETMQAWVGDAYWDMELISPSGGKPCFAYGTATYTPTVTVP
jgi:hypothetical protein